MFEIVFLLLYIVILILLVIILIIGTQPTGHSKKLSRGLYNILNINCEEEKNLSVDDLNNLCMEVERFFNSYIKKYPGAIYEFKYVTKWLDNVLLNIYLDKKHETKLKEYREVIVKIHVDLEKKNLYYNFSQEHQSILRDLDGLSTSQNDIALNNIKQRIGNELQRLTTGNRRNIILNIISIFFGVMGFAFSVIMAFIK